MPEGPEVRRYADLLDKNLAGETLLQLSTRLKIAKAWLAENAEKITNQEILRIRSHGKHLLGYLSRDFYFHSHLMMWGRWEIVAENPPEVDRRERARLVTRKATAILLSAPTFELGKGEPYEQIEILKSLGTDVLPYTGKFDEKAFLARLLAPENLNQEIGSILLNQRVVAGIGNYLRAEILYLCKINPWRTVGELTGAEIKRLVKTIPKSCARAYKTGGGTVTETDKNRLLNETGLAYKLGSEWGARHYVFRRTNLPCLICAEKIRQKRQVTRHKIAEEDREKTRIIYFCPHCQNVNL